MKILFKFYAVWAVLAFAVLLFLAWFPITGFFIAIFGGFYWVGLVPHVIVLALIIDILRTRFRVLAVLPLLPYVYYNFAYYAEDQARLAEIEARLRNGNPGQVLAYDPDAYALVSESDVTARYKIPVSYSRNGNFYEGFLSYRIATKDYCDRREEIGENALTYGVSWTLGGINHLKFVRFSGICTFRMPERPDKRLIEIRSSKDSPEKHLITYTDAYFLDDQLLGSFVKAKYAALPPFPRLTIGCFLNDSPSEWSCIFDVARDETWLQTDPDGAGWQIWSGTRVLGIDKYTDAELRAFEDWPQNVRAFETAIAQRKLYPPDEWGIRANSPYMPKIGERNGYPSFAAVVGGESKAGPFRAFIREHEGEVVYLDIDTNPNPSNRSLATYRVCKVEGPCNVETNENYEFRNSDGSWHVFKETGLFEGFFRIGPAILTKGDRKGDNDTVTVLTVVDPSTSPD